jgi:hypothetical protein
LSTGNSSRECAFEVLDVEARGASSRRACGWSAWQRRCTYLGSFVMSGVLEVILRKASLSRNGEVESE